LVAVASVGGISAVVAQVGRWCRGGVPHVVGGAGDIGFVGDVCAVGAAGDVGDTGGVGDRGRRRCCSCGFWRSWAPQTSTREPRRKGI
jgi:hypothetical protein